MLELKNIIKNYPIGSGVVRALKGINLTFRKSEFVSILGPSGCGKSTALNLLCGLQKPTEGRIFFGEDDVTDLPAENRGVGMVFQNYALYPHMSVAENMAFALKLKKTPKDEIDKNTYSIFELEEGVPTYGYELAQAVEDEYLVAFRSLETTLKFTSEGITYDQLSAEDQEEYEDVALDFYESIK